MARISNPFVALLDGMIDQVKSRNRPSVAMMDPGLRLEGRTFMVTGANVGLGEAIAQGLAERGAGVVMACRTGLPDAGERIARRTGNPRVVMRYVDLSDLRQVHVLCDRLHADGIRFDGVVCNAAVMPAVSRLSPDGLELMFAVNYFANVVLLSRLLADGVIPNRTWSKPSEDSHRAFARIVCVSSEAHRQADTLRFDTWGRPVSYNGVTGMRRYGEVKLALTTFAAELARRLDGDVGVHSVCPGAVNTALARDAPRVVKPVLKRVMQRFFADPHEAARPVLRLVADPRIAARNGLYMHMRTERAPSEQALDAAYGAQLWSANQKLLSQVDPRGWSWPPTRDKERGL